MKKSKFRALALSLALVGAFSLPPVSASANVTQATAPSSVGTDFFVTFNYGWFFDYDRTIYLSALQSGTATITWPNGGTDTYPLSANSITTVNATTKGIVSTGVNERTALISARIVSTVPISVYGTQIVTAERGAASAEAFTAIPTSSLGTSYRLVGPPTIRRQGEFSVVATEDGTTVSITPSVAFLSRPANTTYTVSLQRGQAYTAVAAADRDISGTLVTANKKIAVTSANWCADLSSMTCDHLSEYMPPIDSWGSSFILPGSINRGPAWDSSLLDVYRVLAHQNGTTVTINGTVVATLNAGQIYSHSGTAVSGVQRVDLVQTSKPALVGHFLTGGRHGSADLSGDPSFSLVTPTLQFLKQYNVATPASGFALNILTLVTLSSSVSSVRLNGTQIPVSYGSFVPITGSDFSIARLEVPAGNYSVSSSTGIGVYGSGFDVDISYAYPAGFGLVNLVENPGGVASLPEEVVAAPSEAPAAQTATTQTPTAQTPTTQTPTTQMVSPPTQTTAPVTSLAATGPSAQVAGFGSIIAAALVLTGSALLSLRRRGSLDTERFNSN